MEQEIKSVNHPGYGCNLWITDSMKTLVKLINNLQVNFTVGLVSCGYHMKNRPTGGAIGWIGPGLPADYIKQDFDEENEVLNIRFKLTHQFTPENLEEIKLLCDAIMITPDASNEKIKHTFWCHSEEYQYNNVTKTIYYYKRNGFNEAYEKMKVLMSALTEEKFSRLEQRDANYNPSLILESDEEIKDLELLSSKTFLTKIKDHFLGYDVHISIISIDIERNLNTLDKIFKYCAPFIF